MRVLLWLLYKFTENYCRLQLFSQFIQTQKRYPTSLDKMPMYLENYLSYKAKIFLGTKLLENLLLAKYLISVTVTLIKKIIRSFQYFSKHMLIIYVIDLATNNDM